jgi:hypothetical protein
MMKIADFDDLNEFNLLSELDLLSPTRSDRSVVGSHLSEPTITWASIITWATFISLRIKFDDSDSNSNNITYLLCDVSRS